MLSKTSILVVNALIELAKLPPGQCEGAKTIAKRIQAPQNYLGKLLQGLVYNRIVASQKGICGGFKLIKDPAKITLYEIVEPIDKVSYWSECVLGMKKCSDVSPCVLHDRWKVVRNSYYEFLRNTTIADLAKKP